MLSKNKFGKLSVFLTFVFIMASMCALPVKATEGEPAGEGSSSSSGSSNKTNSQIQEEINQKRKQQKELAQNIKNMESAINKNKQDAAAAQQLRQEYEAYATAIEANITLQLEMIEEQEGEIEIKRLEIVDKEIEFAENEEVLKEIIAAIYKTNTANPISTLMAVDSFADFLIVYDSSQRISKSYTDKLDELMTKKEELERLKMDLEAELVALETKREELENDFARYQQLIADQKAKESQFMQQARENQAQKEAYAEEYEKFEKELEDLFKSLEKSTFSFVGGDLMWPVPSHNGDNYISSHFGNRTLYGRPNFHKGMDIASGGGNSISGQSIVAALDGQVILVDTSNSSSGYGYYLIIDHGSGIRTLYAHCSSIAVSKGAWVSQGSHIASVGNTGNSTGPHLHFELRLDNTRYVNPYPYLAGTASLG